MRTLSLLLTSSPGTRVPSISEPSFRKNTLVAVGLLESKSCALLSIVSMTASGSAGGAAALPKCGLTLAIFGGCNDLITRTLTSFFPMLFSASVTTSTPAQSITVLVVAVLPLIRAFVPFEFIDWTEGPDTNAVPAGDSIVHLSGLRPPVALRSNEYSSLELASRRPGLVIIGA